MTESKQRTPPTCKDAALYNLGRRAYSVAELRKKLKAHTAGYDWQTINSTIDWLIDENLLNDGRYARDRVRYRAEVSRHGRSRILRELKEKGVDEATAQQALTEFEEGLEQPLDASLAPEKVRDEHDWVAEAQALVQAKYKPLPDDMDFKDRQKERAKRINFLLRRGFTSGQAMKALNVREEF